MVVLKHSVIVFCLSLYASVARGDTSTYWRYAGGAPQFVGGRSCALSEGELQGMRVYRRKGYDMCFAPYLKSCLWVAYSLTPLDVSNRVGRVGYFRKDDDLFTEAANPKTYAGSGYDRGHMAPSLDMQYDMDVSRQSFWMGNIAPQTPRLNRGQWKRLEGKIHDMVVANSRGDVASRRVYVLAGPIFSREVLDHYAKAIEKYQKNGCRGTPPLIRPRAFWKIYKSGAEVRAVIMEQKDSTESACGAVTVHGNVSVGEISQVTGLAFFGRMNQDIRNFYLNCRRGTIEQD